MPDTNITIDAQGNVIRGTPGKMTELDVKQKGGHATGRTEHAKQKEEKPAPKKRTPKSKSMSLDQLIGRSGAAKTGEVIDTLTGKGSQPPAAPAPAKPTAQEAPKPKAKPAPEPALAPTPAVTPESPVEDDGSMWTQEAEAAKQAGLPVLTIQFGDITLHFTQGDIDTARNTEPGKRDEMEQAIVDYGDEVERKRQEQVAKEAAIAEARKPKEPEKVEESPVPEPEPEPAPLPGTETRSPGTAPVPKSEGGSKKLDLSSSTPTHQEQSVPRQEPALSRGTPAAEGPAVREKSPLHRVSVQDVCADLELEPTYLRDALQFCAKGCYMGIRPDLYLYYITSYDGDPTYLFGYGPNIAYVRISGGVLRDCNNRFGIDGVCAWVNEMTQVIRRTDI